MIVFQTSNSDMTKWALSFNEFSWEKCKKCPYSEFMQAEYIEIPCLSVFSPDAGKYGPEKLWIRMDWNEFFKVCHCNIAMLQTVWNCLDTLIIFLWSVQSGFKIFHSVDITYKRIPAHTHARMHTTTYSRSSYLYYTEWINYWYQKTTY